MKPKDAQSEPIGAKRSPKGTTREPKGIPKGAKGSPKGAKGEPKDDQNASKNRPSDKVAKMMKKGGPKICSRSHFGSPNRLKFDKKIYAKIDGQKVMKNDEQMI